MNIDAYNLDSLRVLVRKLEKENKNLKQKLNEANIPSQADLSLIRIFNLKHKSRFMDTSDNDHSLILREFFTGFYGIFQGVGKADGKFRRINGESFGNHNEVKDSFGISFLGKCCNA